MRDGVSAMFQLAEPSFALLNSGFKSDPVDIETTASMQRKSTVVFICSGKVCCEVDLVPLHLYGYMDFPVYFSARELESLFKKFSWFWYSRGAWNSESIYSQPYCSFIPSTEFLIFLVGKTIPQQRIWLEWPFRIERYMNALLKKFYFSYKIYAGCPG